MTHTTACTKVQVCWRIITAMLRVTMSAKYTMHPKLYLPVVAPSDR